MHVLIFRVRRGTDGRSDVEKSFRPLDQWEREDVKRGAGRRVGSASRLTKQRHLFSSIHQPRLLIAIFLLWVSVHNEGKMRHHYQNADLLGRCHYTRQAAIPPQTSRSLPLGQSWPSPSQVPPAAPRPPHPAHSTPPAATTSRAAMASTVFAPPPAIGCFGRWPASPTPAEAASLSCQALKCPVPPSQMSCQPMQRQFHVAPHSCARRRPSSMSRASTSSPATLLHPILQLPKLSLPTRTSI